MLPWSPCPHAQNGPQECISDGTCWLSGETLDDGALPFELGSAPQIFTVVADALVGVFWCKGVKKAIHYLDDLILLGVFEDSARNMCRAGGTHKVEGPASVITFLAIVIDSGAQQLRIYTLGETVSSTYSIETPVSENITSCRRRELLSLIGNLNHAAAVVAPGRTFWQHLIELSSTMRHLDHHIHLRVQARSDMLWWLLLTGMG